MVKRVSIPCKTCEIAHPGTSQTTGIPALKRVILTKQKKL